MSTIFLTKPYCKQRYADLKNEICSPGLILRCGNASTDDNLGGWRFTSKNTLSFVTVVDLLAFGLREIKTYFDQKQ